MLYILYSLNALLMIGLPIVLAIWLARRTGAPWRLFGIGLLTFAGSQVIHIPLNAALATRYDFNTTQPAPAKILLNAALLGLTAGVCEEGARYIGYRWLARQARHFRDALMLGAGHGGTEAIILGLLAGLSLVNLAVARGMDLSQQGLSPQVLKQAQQAVAAYWSAPWYQALLGALERLFAITIQVSLSVLVLQAFTRRNAAWLAFATGYHMLVDAVAVVGMQYKWPAVGIEAAIAPLALSSLAIILWLRPRGQPLAPPQPEPVLVPGASGVAIDAAWRAEHEQLDNSRYV